MVSFRNRPLVERTGRARVPTRHGVFTAYSFVDSAGLEHIVHVAGDPAAVPEPLVRVHSECLTGDVFGSLRCDCGSQLDRAMALVGESNGGAVVYVRGHEGRGIGLGQKLRAYALQDEGLDTVDANHALGFPTDSRQYDVAASILIDLGIERVRLLTNSAAKSRGLSANGIEVVEEVRLPGVTTAENARYLETKKQRMSHALELFLDA